MGMAKSPEDLWAAPGAGVYCDGATAAAFLSRCISVSCALNLVILRLNLVVLFIDHLHKVSYCRLSLRLLRERKCLAKRMHPPPQGQTGSVESFE